MRVLVNGKPVDGLDPKLERRLSVVRRRDSVEGVVLTADAIVAARARTMRILFGFLGGLCVLTMGALLFAAAKEAPRDLPIVVALALLGALAIGSLMAFGYRRDLAKTAAGAGPRLARMAPPGTMIRVDDTGLTVGRQANPWPAVEVDALEITRVSGGEGADS